MESFVGEGAAERFVRGGAALVENVGKEEVSWDAKGVVIGLMDDILLCSSARA